MQELAPGQKFARYERKFQDANLQAYFNSQDWYEADAEYSDSMLDDVEKYNATTILQTEKSRGCL